MKNKSHTKRKKAIYGFCIAGMVLLVIVSLFLPQILFVLQDKYRMENTEIEARSNLDITQWNASYEQQLHARLSNFLNMRDTTVTAIEYEFAVDSELGELVNSVLFQDWFGMLYDKYDNFGIINYAHTEDFDVSLSATVQDCKKYLVHGKDYQDGVALMMWYLDLYLESVDTRIQLLVDTETDTIYYVKTTGGVERSVEDYEVDKNQVERLYYWADSIPYYYEFYYFYYEADNDVLFKKYGSSDKEWPWLIETKIEDYCEVVFPLYYGELSIDFLVRAEQGKGDYLDLTMGLPVIGEMIPEMMQD